MAKKTVFITAELDWSESQLESWKEYIDNNPVGELTDRQVGKTVVTIEQQGKFIQETMKNYLALLEVVNNLREKDEAKKEARGSAEVPHRMRRK